MQPASTVSVPSSGSQDRIRFIRFSDSSTSPGAATAPPQSPVLPPWGTTAIPRAMQ